MRIRFWSFIAAVLCMAWLAVSSAEAAVAVVANYSGEKVEFSVISADGKAQPHRLEATRLVSIPLTDQIGIAYIANGQTQRRKLGANSVHYFVRGKKQLELTRLALPSTIEAPAVAPAATPAHKESLFTIPVMILVDDNEPTLRKFWEKRLRERMAEASKIFEEYCRVKLKVVAVGSWKSDDSIQDFNQSLREFELKVIPTPARLAIGFTSQYRIAQGTVHLGGTRGALRSHILIREWSQHITKTERLEVLVHEIGHVLGAIHSPEYHSVMRPTLGDHRSHAVSFHIGFDPLNTLAMCLLTEEMQARPIRWLHQLRPQTKENLRDIYRTLGKTMPKDDSAKHYAEMLDRPPFIRLAPANNPDTLAAATKVVVRAIVQAAQQNVSPDPTGSVSPLQGDKLMEYYVRRAAIAARRVPRNYAPKAFLLGLGIGTDSSNVLRESLLIGKICRKVESDDERRKRLTVLGSPTVHNRRDLAQHFAVSCALSVVVGSRGAEIAAIAKELADARSGSGFSFADLAADLAGIAFADNILASPAAGGTGSPAVGVTAPKLSLDRVASRFTVADYLPVHTGLPEGISWDKFRATYGSTADDRFSRAKAVIQKRIEQLKGYRLL
ncbi:MAG: matrixin family metalloprotease [Candidatus Nealsonbacteria bacterium]|nr:matrixin family metalloprotease [Candidatus Nealsonbacteria bacterium]